uniref:TSA: Wollemia nobilis Ref_Wollemi_Transcript_21687_1028 transcribed RNA sequence n=1 Tax=Wollemia nobilis TaxID=56998 RepID=A0A0C9S579_9CONI
MATGAVLSLNHVARETSDVQRLAKFYQEVLGFDRIEAPPRDFEVVWLTLPPSFALHIIQRNPDSSLPQSPYNTQAATEKLDPEELQRGHHIAFCVSDFDAFVRGLKEKGIPAYEKTQQGGKLKQVFFFDPDGNGLEVQWSAS